MRVAILSVLLLGLTGCNSAQLQYTSLKISRTIPDLQEKQVMDNLARLAADPGNLPYFSVINAGLVNIQDAGSGGLSSLVLQHRAFPSATLNATASRTVSGNWTLNPLVSPDRLRAMRAAYQIALGVGPIENFDMEKLLEIEQSQSIPPIAQGWICMGGKHDYPKGERLVAHDGSTYVWVKPGHSKDFADFSLLMLNIATYAPASPDSTKINLSIDKIVPIQIKESARSGTATEALPPLPQPDSFSISPTLRPPAIHRRLYEDSSSINRGLFLVPR